MFTFYLSLKFLINENNDSMFVSIVGNEDDFVLLLSGLVGRILLPTEQSTQYRQVMTKKKNQRQSSGFSLELREPLCMKRSHTAMVSWWARLL